MEKYSVSVALFDYLPVITSGVGVLILARALSAWLPNLRLFILLAAISIPLGGLCKASWKLLIALGHAPIPWLENLLFILLAPGFVILAFAMHHARRAWQTSQAPNDAKAIRLLLWLSLVWPVAAALAFSLEASRAWFFYLLAITSLANAALIIHALITARKTASSWLVDGLLIISFIATLSLSGLSRLPDSETTAWIQECVNLSAQLSLAVAFWLLTRRMMQRLPHPTDQAEKP